MKKVYNVSIVFEVISEESSENIQEKVQALLDHGTIRDAFDSASMDTSYFRVEKVEE